MNNMIKMEKICKYYGAEKQVKALDQVSMDINPGEFVIVRGPSGCGKTTMLLALGGMLHPTSGTISISGKDLYRVSVGERAKIRSENIGFVFQMFHLLPYLSVLDNVMLAKKIKEKSKNNSSVRDLLNRLGLSDRIDFKPSDISAGEKQRTALARAMVNGPQIILADEPTGNLDPENADRVMTILKDFNNQGGTVVVVTHGDHAEKFATRTVQLEKGRIID
jgi:ABC-type lipoprotein export system ATPase subunit